MVVRSACRSQIGVSVAEFVTDVLGFEPDECIWLGHKEEDETPEGRFVQDEAVRVRDLIEPKDEYRGYSLAELLAINPREIWKRIMQSTR